MTTSECLVCGGDCAGANPPVLNCPTELLEEVGRLTAQVENLKAIRRSQNAEIARLQGELNMIQGQHDWLYGEKHRLQDALDKIANCGPRATKGDLMEIARRNIPTREGAIAT